MKHYLLLMRASILFLLLIVFGNQAFSQVPPTDLNGQDLRIWLKANYYDGQHITLGYGTIENETVGTVPIFHDIQALVDLAAQIFGRQVAAQEDRLDGPA